MCYRRTAEFAMDSGWAEWWLLKGEAFGKLMQLIRKASPVAAIVATGTNEPGETELAVTAEPALRCAQCHRGIIGDPCQRHILFEMRAQLMEAFERALALRLGEFG